MLCLDLFWAATELGQSAFFLQPVVPLHHVLVSNPRETGGGIKAGLVCSVVHTLSVPSLIFWVRPSSVSRIKDPSSSIPLVMPVTVLSWLVTWTWRGRWIQLCHHSSSIDDGLSISSYLDMVWSAIVFRSLRRSYFV